MHYVHSPIMIEEIINLLVQNDSKYFLDCTIGEGGHAETILTRFPDLVLYGLDRNLEILNIARNRLSIFRERFFSYNINFKDIERKNIDFYEKNFDGCLIDLGISMYHYKESKQGFSFNTKERLDMRLDNNSIDVYDVINSYPGGSLADIFYKYGEERFSRKIVENIICERTKRPIEYTDDLANIILNSIPKKFHSKHIHPATKCFQALRIFSNNELENIKQCIPNILSLLKKGGRLGVITFHSLEDRIVKQIFTHLHKDCICPPGVPICNCGKKREINWVVKFISAKPEEIKINPSARSAKLRVVEKV